MWFVSHFVAGWYLAYKYYDLPLLPGFCLFLRFAKLNHLKVYSDLGEVEALRRVFSDLQVPEIRSNELCLKMFLEGCWNEYLGTEISSAASDGSGTATSVLAARTWKAAQAACEILSSPPQVKQNCYLSNGVQRFSLRDALIKRLWNKPVWAYEEDEALMIATV